MAKIVIATCTDSDVPALISCNDSYSICSGSTFYYTPISNVQGTVITWTRDVVAGISNLAGSGGGSISEILENTTASPIDVIYNISLTYNGITTTTTYTVTVNPLPICILVVTGDDPLCIGDSVDIAVSPQSGPVSYIWSTGETTVSITVSPTETTTYSVVITDANGCSNIGSATITVCLQATIDPQDSMQYVGDQGCVYTTESGMTNYAWTISAGGSPTAGGGTTDDSVTVSWITIGDQTISVIYDEGSCCEPAVADILVLGRE
jgi:hypothetical protein